MAVTAAAALLLASVSHLVAAAEVSQERRLADGIVQHTYPDGRRTLVVGETELADRTPAPEPPPAHATEDDSRRGFVLYRRSPEQVFRGSSPRTEERITDLRTAIALGETRHVQFAIYALADLGHVEVSFPALRRREGAPLPADAITVRPVRIGFWRNYWDPWFQEQPKLIDRPGTATDVSQAESQQYWVSVSVPASAAAGQYHTVLRVEPANGQAVELPLTIDVLPFQLDLGRWWGIYYYPGFNENTPRDFADMKSHGVNAMLICPPGNREPVLERRGDRVVASFPMTDKAMAELKRQGFQRPTPYFPRLLSCRVLRMFDRIDGQRIKEASYYGQPAASYQAKDFPKDLKPVMKDLYRQVVRHAREANWPEVLWYLVDEPGAATGHSMEMEWAKLEFQLFAEACPDEKLFCTAYSQAVADDIGVPIDVRSCDLWRIGEADVARADKENTQLWAIRWLCQYNTYQFPRHFAGFGLDKIGLHGFTEWTYYGAPVYRPFDQVRSVHGCHYAFRDEQENLLSTITWEGVQEGINDARYVATLRRRIDAAWKSTQQEHQTLAVSAQESLDGVLADIPRPTATLSQGRLDELRARVSRQIMRFVDAGLSPNR